MKLWERFYWAMWGFGGGVIGFALLLALVCTAHSATTLLPPGEQCFQTANGPISSGSINMYIPNTSTPKATWQDAGQTVLNTQPIQLDANGCAIIYGTGSYRQQVFTGPVVGGLTTGNLVFDLVTTDTSAYNSVFWAAGAAGTPNAITVVDPGFNGTDGTVINFLALSANTGPTTLNPSGYFVVPPQIMMATSTGPQSLSAGVLGPGNAVSVVWVSSTQTFQLLSVTPAAAATVAITPPQGYLTLSSDQQNPIVTADTAGATSIYYTPYVGQQVPIFNGTSFVVTAFTQMVLTLSGSQIGSTIYDSCVFLNNGIPTLVAGPAWSSSTAGSSTRGAGVAAITRLNGIWVNNVQITGLNGANSYTIPANQCTYVGTFFTDATPGQVSCTISYGQSRKWGVWNAYNRVPIALQVGDPTASWTYSTNTIRPSNNDATNSLTVLMGLPEETVYNQFLQEVDYAEAGQTSMLANISTGIGWNSTTTFSGTKGQLQSTFNSVAVTTNFLAGTTNVADYMAPPSIGVNTVTALEVATTTNGTVNFFGTQLRMVLTTRWRG